MLAPVAKTKAPAVNRLAKIASPSPSLDEERDARLKLEAREDISFELVAYRMGVELSGYLEIECVPRWLGLVAREVWIALPEDQGDLADRYVGRLVKAAPQEISDAASLKVENVFILETLRSLRSVCKAHEATSSLLDRACSMLDNRPGSGEWDDIGEAAFALQSQHPEDNPLHSAAIAIQVAADRDSYSALHSWSHAQNALGNRKFSEADGAIRRSTETMKRLSRRVFKAIRQGHALTKPSRKRAAA